MPVGSDQQSNHSIFAGALWIGGIDDLDQLKVAAQTYRQTGDDFWPGPLNGNGETTQEMCNNFDRFWEVKGKDIADFIAAFEKSESGELSAGEIPASILTWPGRNNQFFTAFDLPLNKELAPFYDVNGNGDYEPHKGDYPVIDKDEQNYADQMIWWMFNDKGNIHTETQGEAIGLEVSAMAFAFATNDEVNNQTFYKYVVNNLSTQPLDSVYFGQWVDPDLGAYDDDYVGCFPDLGLGYVYNGTSEDANYGKNPPVLGVDFFEGPKTIAGEDEDGNLVYEELGMSAFVFYNNDFTKTGNPENASHFYGYLAGVWKDGTDFTFGGNGYGGSKPSPYMFPDNPSLPSPAWSECSSNNEPADRRFLQSSGPFRLEPGAINDVIVGVIWTRACNYPCPDLIPCLVSADKKAQALFDNNFKLKDGPDAPNIAIRELDKEIILTLWYDESRNNFREGYEEADAVLSSQGFKDSIFYFQGYKIFQLANPLISPAEYDDVDKARLVEQVDIRDNIDKMINYIFDGDVGSLIPKVMVNGNNQGIKHTFQIKEDKFATGDLRLVNNKKYYYSAVAYGYNTHEPYNPATPVESAQKEPYIEGRNNVKVYTAIPHIASPQNNGVILNSVYGDGPEINRIKGLDGNGGFNLELTMGSVGSIFAGGSGEQVTYQARNAPVDVQIIDPMNVQKGTYELTLIDVAIPEIEQPKYGKATLDHEGKRIIYVPNDKFKGYDEIIYTLGDNDCNLEIGAIAIIGAVEEGEWELTADTRIMEYKEEQDSILISVFDNDFAPSGTDLKITYIMDEDNDGYSISSIDSTAGTFYFRPDSLKFGMVSFLYRAIPQGGDFFKTARVYVNIYEPDVYEETSVLDAVDDVVATIDDISYDKLWSNDLGNFNTEYLSPFSVWTLQNLDNGDTYYSDRDLKVTYEQVIGNPATGGTGISVKIAQAGDPGTGIDGVVSSSLNFADVQNQWLSFVADVDGVSYANWIRSGEINSDGDHTDNDLAYDDAASNRDSQGDLSGFYDPDQYYEDILDKQLSPYCLANNAIEDYLISPGCTNCYTNSAKTPTNTLDELSSVDIIYTSNKELWTQCVVVEMNRTTANSQGRANKNDMRRSPSLNLDGSYESALPAGTKISPGNSYYVKGTSAAQLKYTNNTGTERTVSASSFFTAGDIDADTDVQLINGAELYRGDQIGRSWFPGYAINLETGKRLNMMFGENSFYKSDNGADMIWNPTSTRFSSASGPSSMRLGGEHYVYVMNSAYDGGVANQALFVQSAAGSDIESKKAVYDDAMWVTTTLLAPGFELLSYEDGIVPSPVEVKVRVNRGYRVADPVNDRTLVYQFTIGDELLPQTNVQEVANESMDLVKIVPNPYYGYAEYENSQLDNRVRITNLPARADITIFTLNGELVERIRVDNKGLDTSTGAEAGKENINSVDWDITNVKNIPISSGVYLIHIDAPDLGQERTLKWFCIRRPVDLDIF